MESSNACLWVLSGAFCQSLRNLEFEFSPISSCNSVLRTNALFRPNQSWDPVFQVWLFKVSFSFLSYNHENKSCSFPEAEGKQLNINVKGNLGPQWHLAASCCSLYEPLRKFICCLTPSRDTLSANQEHSSDGHCPPRCTFEDVSRLFTNLTGCPVDSETRFLFIFYGPKNSPL